MKIAVLAASYLVSILLSFLDIGALPLFVLIKWQTLTITAISISPVSLLSFCV